MRRTLLSRLLTAFGMVVFLHYFSVHNAEAQITIILNTPPQLPERVNDWERLNALFSVTVTNTGLTPLQRLRLAATVTNLDNNAVLFRTKNDLTRPFNAPPRVPQTLTAPQILPANSFEYDASVQTALIRTNTLPEGAYRLCVRVIDERGTTLGMEQCRTFNVVIPDPPSLISPVNGDSVRRAAPSVPLNLQFQWTQVFARFGQQSKYKLRVVPIFEGQQPRQALEGNPVLLEKIVQTSSYQLLPSDPQFSNYPNATGFAWQVQAIDPNDVSLANVRAVGRNFGKSEIFTFGLGQSGSRTSPVAGGGDNGKGKKKSPFDNSPKGTERISSNTPMPMSVIKGVVKWSYRAAALGEAGLQGTSNLPSKAVLCTGETVSALVGNNIGASPSSSVIAAAAGGKQYPLPNMTVKVVAAFPNQGTISTNIGGKPISINTALSDILLGTATTNENGAFVLEFVNPIFAKQGAYIGDSVITRTKKTPNAKGQLVDVPYKDTVQLFATTGDFEKVIIKVIAESPHFLLEEKSFPITADSTKKTIEVGTVAALARTFRLKTTVLKKVQSGAELITLKAANPLVSVYRPQEFYQDSANAALIPEKKLKGLTVVNNIGGVACARLQQAVGDQTCSPLFLNQNGLHDRYYLRVSAEKCQTLETVLQVNAASVAKDGIAEVHQRVVLNSAGGSLVQGNIKRLNLQNLEPKSPLSAAQLDPLNTVKLALVPFVTLGEKVEARLNVFTDPNGNFTIDSVPKGAYLLQVAGATLYFNEQYELAKWMPQFIIGDNPTKADSDPPSPFQYEGGPAQAGKLESSAPFSPGLLVVVDGESEVEKMQGYVVSPLAVVCGRLTDDLENLAGGVTVTENSSMKASAATDEDGRFAINVPHGQVTLDFKRPGFPKQTKYIQVNAPENFFIPPVQIIKFDPKTLEDEKTSVTGGNGKMTNLLIKLKGLDKGNPGNVSKTSIADLFGTTIMRGIATGAMSKMVNSPSMLPVGANGSNFTMSGTGYSALASPMTGLSIKGAKGAYSQAESNLFGAFTADVFSGGKAAGTKAFGKDAGWEDVTLYNNLAGSSARAPLAEDEINTDAVTIYDMGVTAINRGISLEVTVIDKASKSALDKAKATIGAKSALTGIVGEKPVPAIIKELKPGAQAITTVPVRIEGPEAANYIPQVVDAGLNSSADVSYLTVSLTAGARVTGKIVLQDENGNMLQNQPSSLFSSISIREQGFEELSFTTVKSDGSFVLRGVKTGGTTVVAALSGFIAAKATVKLKANENAEITLTLKKSAIALEKIFGFPVEITALTQNGDKASADGAFINIPSNKTFALPEGTRIPFHKLNLVKAGNSWIPEGNTVLTELSNLPVQAWKGMDKTSPDGIPLVVKGAAGTKFVSITKKDNKDNDANKGIIIGDVFLDYGKFVQQGKGPWKFGDVEKMQLDDVPPLLRSDGSEPSQDLALKLPNMAKSVTIYSIKTQFESIGSTIKADGIHLQGALTLADDGFKDFFLDKDNKPVKFMVKEFQIKPNAAIGAVDISSGASGIAFHKGSFDFNLSAIDFTVEGLTLTGTMGFTMASGLLQATNIGFEKLQMFTSKESGGFSVAAGTFSFDSKDVTLSGFPIGGKGFSFGIVPNSDNVFFLRGSGNITDVPLVKKLGLTLEVRSDESAIAIAETDFKQNWADIAEFSLSGMTLDTQAGTLDVDGSIALGIPGVASLGGGGFVFKSGQKTPTIKSFGGEIDFKVAKLKIDALSFGDNLPEPPKIVDPNVGGPSADAWSEPSWLEDPRKGFSAQGVAITIPGLGLNATANFSYYALSGGRELSVDLNVDGLPPITVGPVFIQPTGGGFTVNTADKDLALKLFSDISILNPDVIALKPTIMELKVGASAGVQISAKALLQLYSQKAGNAKMFFAPTQKKFRVTAEAQLEGDKLFSVPAVKATGIANITLDLDGNEGYMYAGVGVAAAMNVAGLIEAKANAGLILGYKAPRTAMTPEQALVLPASYQKFSGVAFALDTKLGQEEHEASTYDIWICDAKVWAYSKGGTKFFLLRNDDTKNISFGFDANTGWGGGARCGCVGASIAVGAQIGGGYEDGGRGWYFGGKASGSAELCLGWCVDLDASIELRYQQHPPSGESKTYFDIDVDF